MITQGSFPNLSLYSHLSISEAFVAQIRDREDFRAWSALVDIAFTDPVERQRHRIDLMSSIWGDRLLENVAARAGG